MPPQEPKQPQQQRKRRRLDPLAPPPPATDFPPYQAPDFFRFELLHQSSKSAARVGRIHTPHGIVNTPGFVSRRCVGRQRLAARRRFVHQRSSFAARPLCLQVAVGTNAVLKAVDTHAADAEGLELMFANTYHCMLHPGAEVIGEAGGLHAFMNRRRDRPIITGAWLGSRARGRGAGTLTFPLN